MTPTTKAAVIRPCILPFPHRQAFVVDDKDGNAVQTFEFVATEPVKPTKLIIPAQFAFAFDVLDIAYRATEIEKIQSFLQGKDESERSVPASVFTEGCMYYPNLFNVTMSPGDKIFLKVRNHEIIRQPFTAVFIGTPPPG